MPELLTSGVFEHLTTSGFAFVKIDQGSREIIRRTFEAASNFFRSDYSLKNSSRRPNDMGYRPIGVEFSESSDRPDQVESFTASMRFKSFETSFSSGIAQSLYTHMLSAIDVMEPIAEAIALSLANRLGGESCGQRMRGGFRRWSRLQLNYSRPATVLSSFINDVHEDGDLLTVACATAPGLEVQTSTGEFIPITTGTDKVVIMPGEIVWLLSGGQVKPLYHRVRPNSAYAERMSILLFADIHPNLCEPWIRNAINLNVDIGARVLTNANKYGQIAFQLE